jgi:phage baseplate assembly protein W
MATWLLQSPAAPSAAAEPAAQGDVPFERRGLLMPFQRDQKQDFANGTGIDLICSNVQQVLGMRGQSDTTPGELPFEPEMGSLLHLLRHQNINAVRRHQAEIYVVDALARWEPRVEVRSVTVETRERAYLVRTRFDILDRFGRGAVLATDLEAETEVARAA